MKKSKPQSKGILIFMLLVVVLLFLAHLSPTLAGNNAGGAFNQWPDTGQAKCYNNIEEISCPDPGDPFYGQDAQYQGPQRSYTKLGYGGVELPDSATQAEGWIMTRDNVTGLIWEIKTDDGGVHDKDNIYTWCDTNPDTSGGNEGACDEESTEDFISALNTSQFGGFSDWRLPTIKELSTLVLSSDVPSSQATIDATYFPNTVSSIYWSSTSYFHGSIFAWCVRFSYGGIHYGQGKFSNAKFYVRAVRSGEDQGDRYVDNHDGTVTDTKTGLMWQKCTIGQVYNADTNECQGSGHHDTWQGALHVCETLDLAGFDDWRLPNRNELQSIVDYSHYSPSIDTNYFPNTESSYYWSSTTHPTNTDNAWCVIFETGSVNYSEKSTFFPYVRAVRSIQTGILGDADHDSDVDGKDLSGFVAVLSTGDYNPVFDLNHDDQLNGADIEIFAANFGKN